VPPLVSILIPAFNAQEWLAETLCSALAQTWARIEVVVVDDGSRDETPAIARRFAHPNVQVVTQSNQGAAAARNRAFTLCQGDYVQWLDADDLLAPNKIALQMELVERDANDRWLYSAGWASFMYRPHRAVFAPTLLWEDLSPVEWLLRKWENDIYMQTATWLVSRRLTQAAGLWDTSLLGDDDGEYFSRVIQASQAVRFAPDAKVLYRRTGSNSLSYVGLSSRKMEAQFRGMKLQIGYLRAMTDDTRARGACIKYLQSWLPQFYPNRMDLVEEAFQIAADLGGRLVTPRLSWNYDWIRKLFGWNLAKRADLTYNHCKGSLLRSWDKTLFRLGT